MKAVVDAYDGTVTLYVVDTRRSDRWPLTKAFPELFTHVDEMPEELREHFRYPEDLFTVQTTMWGRYHITDSQTFYEKTTAWAVRRPAPARRER